MQSVRAGPDAALARRNGSAAVRRAVDAVISRLAAGRHTILYTASERAERAEYLARGRRIGVSDVPQAVAERLGRIAARAAAGCPALGAVVAFGGDTAVALLREMGISLLRPVCEPWPGVVISESAIGAGGPAIVTKCGGFGPPDLLEKLERMCEQSHD
jgi:uncharacterized protein YgbK (DUF1537 family)